MRFKFLTVLLLAASLAQPCFAAVDIFRHEAVIRNSSEGQFNSSWWIHEEKHFQAQVYAFFDTGYGTWNELNLTSGPILKLSNLSIAFPIGIRFHPEEDWELTHLIGKVNGFGTAGDFRYFFINDMSMGRRDRKNEHFLQYQFAWKPQGRRIGYGIQSDAFLLGSTDLSWTVGPVVKVTYYRQTLDRGTLDWTVDVYPFYDMTLDNFGARFNFLTFRFEK